MTIKSTVTTIAASEMMTSVQVAEITGKAHGDILKYIRALLYQGVSNVNFILTSYKDAKGQNRPAYHITNDGISILAIKYKNDRLASMCDKVVVHNATRFELSFGSMLTEMFNELGIDVVNQYNVDGYRIDFYLPEFNIVIEYDEAQHSYKTNIEKDTKREKYIKEKIGCKFIRVDYKDSDVINIAKVLKQVTTIKK